MWFPTRILFVAGFLFSGLLVTSAILASLNNQLSQEPEVVSLMTYKSAIEYFITNRPNSPDIKKGAILREAHTKGYLVSLLFLDEANEIVCKNDATPYGRKVIVQQFDEELADAFRGTNMIFIT